MVVNKRWNIGSDEYLLSQNMNQNKIRLHINSVNYSDKEPTTLFHAYKYIFEDLGSFRLSTIDGLIHINIDNEYDIDINIFNYNLLIAYKGETIKSIINMNNIYECFDTVLRILEEE